MNDSLSSLPSDPDALAARLMNSAHLGDGLPEIFVGIICLLYCAMAWCSHLAQRHSPAARLATLVLVIAVTLTGLTSVFLIRWVRARYLTARSGYVRRKPHVWRLSTIVGAGALIGAILTLVALGLRGLLAQHWLILITGLLFGALWMFLGRRRRFVVSGVLIALAAIPIGFSPLQVEIAWTAFYAFAGILTFGSGILVFRRHIRSTAEEPQ